MDNPLDTTPPYPHELSFVLRLHRSTGPHGQGFKGRLLHLATGTQLDFGDFAGLQAALQASIEHAPTHS